MTTRSPTGTEAGALHGGLGWRVPQRAARLLHPPGALLGRPPSAALLGPCSPALALHSPSLRPMRYAAPAPPSRRPSPPRRLGRRSARQSPTEGHRCIGCTRLQ
ncbi:hypothetical protein F0U60_11955 [Archangium minus]|uniref:Uncharacterized protein n=1 Tax=Archangium minus TaxID=83450 RepID=A0ABY9WPR3_9BACT|nr:hypothetical protein F0U60_11955 [Archangium minus]